MNNFILIILLTICYTSNLNYQLLDILYEEKNWILDEKLEDNSEIYFKNINDFNLKAIKISRDIEIDPLQILKVIKNINNYNDILKNSPNVITTPIQSADAIIAKHDISIPLFNDLYYFFKIGESSNKVYWTLEDSDNYKKYQSSGSALSIGCGGWDYKKKSNGIYEINYRLIFDIGGYPNWIINYLNYYSLINVYNDVISAALNKSNQ